VPSSGNKREGSSSQPGDLQEPEKTQNAATRGSKYSGTGRPIQRQIKPHINKNIIEQNSQSEGN